MKRLVILWAALAVAAPPANDPGSLDNAMARMYNFDFAGAQRILDDHIRLDPADPLGYTFRASGYLFSELDRLSVLEGGFLTDDKKVADKKKVKQDPVIRVKFYAAIEQAQKLAGGRLTANPKDVGALFAMAISSGCLLDYTNFVEKRPFASLSFARESQGYASRLLAVDPNYADAYMTTGLSEYILGSLPFFVRWFVHFDGVEGNKLTAIKKLDTTATSGRYMKPFAKILLAIIYGREKKYAETERLLAELSKAYPENPLFRKELARLSARRR